MIYSKGRHFLLSMNEWPQCERVEDAVINETHGKNTIQSSGVGVSDRDPV